MLGSRQAQVLRSRTAQQGADRGRRSSASMSCSPSSARFNGLPAQERLRVRQERSRPLVSELEVWLREQRAKLSRNNDTKGDQLLPQPLGCI